MMRRPAAVTSLVAALASLACLACAPSALAASPWWHVNLGSAPARVQPGSAQSEVQEITIAPGAAFELNVGGKEVGLFESEPYPFGGAFTQASAANVQAALEALYGAGNVVVTGGGGSPLIVNSVNEAADQPVESIGVGLSLPSGAVGAKVVRQGRADGQVVITASNLGDADMAGAQIPVDVVDKLPAGLQAVAIEGFSEDPHSIGSHLPLKCQLSGLSCAFTGTLAPYQQVEVRVSVLVAGASSGAVDTASVEGGGAPPASASRSVNIGATPADFGVESYEMTPEEEGGEADTQAGSHPFQLTTTLMLNQATEPNRPPALAKDLSFRLPPGLIGNPTPFPQCTDRQFLKTSAFVNECLTSTVVGVAAVSIFVPEVTVGVATVTVPLFNLEPKAGEPARFGFDALNVPVFLDTAVRTGGDYGVTVNVDNITETATFLGSRVTFWGVPGDPRHDNARGWSCVGDGLFGATTGVAPCTPLAEQHTPPLLGLPTSCATNPETGAPQPLETSVEVDSWKVRTPLAPFPASTPMPALGGCNRLPFSPQISVAPDGTAASTPSGLTVGVHVPQDASLTAGGLSEADVRNTTVTLPRGVTLNPSAADGLRACPLKQVSLESSAEATCPEASKVASVEIKSPLLPNPLVGEAYLAAQNANPFGSLVALYLVAQDPVSGVLVKVAGEVQPDPVTGQLVSTFKNTPQLPFEDLKLHFFGGDRAPLATPGLCGSYTTTASIAPWSGNEPVDSNSTFDVTSGPNGGPCQNPLPFAPSLAAGTTSVQAGGFSPFTMTMSREDGQQNLRAIALKMPGGLSGLLSSVKLCGEPQADEGTCGPESQIGETVISVGLGGDPFSVRGGKVFITGGYEGAPYGLSIVNPAKAGPYDLEAGTPCDCVVVRAKIEVDPITAALTVTSDDSGPYKIPTILDGIPLQIQHVNVSIDRPGFTFNPTNCSPLQIGGSLASDQGAVQALSVPFQVTNCAALAFKPKLTAKTNGKTSRAKGASLRVNLSYPKAPQGTQANIKSVHVELPKALPSRLSTLNHACLDSVFNENPASCPAQSMVGYAKAVTPVLPVPLEGPAYFVSHGGQKFPELIVVLQGYGVTVYLQGETFISKAGITSSTFKSVPDVPVGSFELNLPEGPFSALAANRNLCETSLTMPTVFTAQNGATLKQGTSIEVAGCPYSLRVVHRAVSNHTLTLNVSVPQAGRLSAKGNGLTSASKGASARQTLTLTLKQRHAGRLHTKVLLRFTPAKGKQRKALRTSITVTLG